MEIFTCLVDGPCCCILEWVADGKMPRVTFSKRGDIVVSALACVVGVVQGNTHV